jgi:hypothetical protein
MSQSYVTVAWHCHTAALRAGPIDATARVNHQQHRPEVTIAIKNGAGMLNKLASRSGLHDPCLLSFFVLRIIDTWVSICTHRAISVPTKLMSRLIRLCVTWSQFRKTQAPLSVLLCDICIQRICPILGRSWLPFISAQQHGAMTRRYTDSSYQ